MAPLSEYYGRKPVIGISLIALMAFTAGSGGANSIATLLVCRWFAGLLGTAGIAVGAGVISDMFPPTKIALPSAVFILMPFFVGSAIEYPFPRSNQSRDLLSDH